MDLINFAIETLSEQIGEFACKECNHFLKKPVECNQCANMICFKCRDKHKCNDDIKMSFRALNKVMMTIFNRLSSLFVKLDLSVIALQVEEDKEDLN